MKESLINHEQNSLEISQEEPAKFMENNQNNTEHTQKEIEELSKTVIDELEDDLKAWTELRQETIKKLKAIADYVDSVTKKGIIARAVGSGGGVLAGGLTIVGKNVKDPDLVN